MRVSSPSAVTTKSEPKYSSANTLPAEEDEHPYCLSNTGTFTLPEVKFSSVQVFNDSNFALLFCLNENTNSLHAYGLRPVYQDLTLLDDEHPR